MTDQFIRYRKLVERLYEKTIQKTLDWQFSNKSLSVVIADNNIELIQSSNDDGEPLNVVLIKNKNGSFIDRFSDEDLKGQPDIEGVTGWWSFMDNLYTRAYRQAVGADAALDDILSALDSD